MYPQRHLTALAWHKGRLQQRIAQRREQCAATAADIARPLEWVDRALTFWRKLAPFAAVPLGLLAGRTLFPRRRILGTIVRWGPALFGAVRGLTAVFRNR